jgi:hypothetical protein
MTRQVKAMAGEHPVEAAIREGRIPASRRDHYMKLMASKPKKTAKLLAKLEPVLEPPEVMEGVRQYVEQPSAPYHLPVPAAPIAAAPTGPSEYPQEWVGPVRRSGSITFEDPQSAAQAGAVGFA